MVEETVKEAVVKAQDVERLGLLCKCHEDLCKRHQRDAYGDAFGRVC